MQGYAVIPVGCMLISVVSPGQVAPIAKGGRNAMEALRIPP